MGREQFSATQSATDPILPCEKGIRPIFPTRFAIKPSVLNELSKSPRAICQESSIINTGDHELRRIRQGYVYIFVPNQIEDEDSRTETSNGYWMVFRYQTQLDDFNSHVLEDYGSIPFSIRNPDTDPYVGLDYSFRQYSWLDGYAAGRWGFNDSKIYPYVYVPKQVTKIEIAYSEHRWPAKFFERAEVDASFRKTLMVPIDLAPQRTDFSMPMSELEHHVVDFKKDLFSDISFIPNYADAHTGIFPQDSEDVLSGIKELECARIIALHDPIGRVLDINERIHKNDNERTIYNAEYQYPLVTARAVEQIYDVVDDANYLKKFFNDDIVQDQSMWRSYINQSEEFDAVANNLYATHKQSVAHKMDYSIHHQLKQTLELISGTGDEYDCELLVYCTGLLSQLYEGVGNSVQGSQYLEATISKREQGNKAVANIYEGLISQWAKVALAVKVGAQERLSYSLKAFEAFDSFLLVNGPEFAKLRLHYNNPNFMSVLNELYDVKGFSKRPLTIDDVKKVFESGFIPDTSHVDAASANFSQRGGAASIEAQQGITVSSGNRTSTVDMTYIQLEGELVPAAGFDKRAGEVGVSQQKLAGLSVFLNLYSAFDILENRDKSSAGTTLGRIGENFYINLIVAVGSSVNDVYECRRVFANGQFRQIASKSIVNNVYKEFNKSGLLTRSGVNVSRARAGAISGAQVSKFAGKALGIAGILLTSFMAYDGFRTDRKAKGWGNALAAVGSVALMLTTVLGPVGAIVGVILVITGIILEYFGTLNPIEDWAYNCFWGKSDYYWGEGKDRAKLDRLIKESTILAYPDKASYQTMLDHFNKEMKSFENLFLGIKVQNISRKGRQFEVVLPRTPVAASQFTLNIRVREELVLLSMDRHGGETVRQVHLAKQYQYQPGSRIVIVDLSQQAWKNLPVVKVDIEYIDPDGKKFMLNDHQIFKSDQSFWMWKHEYER
ncbi:toxin VasX [Kangiella koreensis]|uniref:Toxin VasX N-terminal region domain-containing protein n=1 Tax=Kangiella koreensis (strain DSM 16069 / JCM 12317 / KCTC 12182 / SW-125) TaxID=523791 RepID=C7RCW5_KANKD|nr:toxin VasX [Kangiella koreensis]ACV27107.1 hypothetical protein Kkor_1695 [Kangiella koreensis DSM 16069]